MSPVVQSRESAEADRLAELARAQTRRQRTKQEIYDGDEELRHIVMREATRRKLKFDLAAVVTGGEIETTIEGASTITLDIHDPRAQVWRSSLLTGTWDIQVDQRWFRLVVCKRSGRRTTLVFESRLVAILRTYRRPRRATRAQEFTRAMFIKSMLDEVREQDIHLVCPELRARQAIEKPTRGGRSRARRDEQREPGFAPGAKVEVKGSRANAAQMKTIDAVLAEAFRLGCSAEVMVACIMCITQETEGGLPKYTHSTAIAAGETHRGPFQQQPGYGSDADILDPTTSTHSFLLGKNGIPGWKQRNGSLSGAPRDLGAAIERVQISGLGSLYNQWRDEATRTVRTWLGGGRAGRRSATRVKPYQFHRGRPDGPKGENTWDAAGRLVDEVGWRRFVVDDHAGGTFYLIAEDDLMASRAVMRFTEGDNGVDEIACDIDAGKPVDTATVSCRMDRWEAHAGEVVEITNFGEATGRWLVSSFRRPLFSTAGTIELRRRSALLHERAEPANDTESVSITGGSSTGGAGSGGAADMVAWAKSQVGVVEGSAGHRRYASAFGLGMEQPWCSVFVGYGLKRLGLSMPGNPAYSGAWLDWSGGSRVRLADIRPGDLPVIDWGDGGITDHVAVYIGNGRMIGGNQRKAGTNGAVTESALPRGFVVGVVRPHYRK